MMTSTTRLELRCQLMNRVWNFKRNTVRFQLVDAKDNPLNRIVLEQTVGASVGWGGITWQDRIQHAVVAAVSAEMDYEL